MQSIIDVGGTMGFVVLALPLIILALAAVLSLAWPRIAIPLPVPPIAPPLKPTAPSKGQPPAPSQGAARPAAEDRPEPDALGVAPDVPGPALQEPAPQEPVPRKPASHKPASLQAEVQESEDQTSAETIAKGPGKEPAPDVPPTEPEVAAPPAQETLTDTSGPQPPRDAEPEGGADQEAPAVAEVEAKSSALVAPEMLTDIGTPPPAADIAPASSERDAALPPAMETFTEETGLLERNEISAPADEEPQSDTLTGARTGGVEASTEVLTPPDGLAEDSEVAASIHKALAARDRGDDQAAADALRDAIIRASRLKDRRGHARARLELGDICQAEGDLITACEHWQMARSLYEEDRDTDDAEVCEKRMLDNGCPTDWVLTDF